MSETLVCWACREPADPWDRYCRYCGAEFTDARPEKRPRRWPWVLVGLGAVVWLLL